MCTPDNRAPGLTQFQVHHLFSAGGLWLAAWEGNGQNHHCCYWAENYLESFINSHPTDKMEMEPNIHILYHKVIKSALITDQ